MIGWNPIPYHDDVRFADGIGDDVLIVMQCVCDVHDAFSPVADMSMLP